MKYLLKFIFAAVIVFSTNIKSVGQCSIQPPLPPGWLALDENEATEMPISTPSNTDDTDTSNGTENE